MAVCKSLFKVSCQNLYFLQQFIICINCSCITNRRCDVFAKGNVEFAGLVYSIKSVETSSVKEKEKSAVFYRI